MMPNQPNPRPGQYPTQNPTQYPGQNPTQYPGPSTTQYPAQNAMLAPTAANPTLAPTGPDPRLAAGGRTPLPAERRPLGQLAALAQKPPPPARERRRATKKSRQHNAQSYETVLGIDHHPGAWWVLVRILLYGVIFLVFTGPLLTLLVSAFGKVSDPTRFSLLPHGLTLENFDIAAHRGVFRYLFNSFVVVGFGLLLQMAVSLFASYALGRKRFRGAALVMLAILATMVLPEEIMAIPLSVVLSDLPLLHVNLIGTYAGMILPVVGWAFSILIMTEFMRAVPDQYEEAARLDGASELRIFWSVILPMCRPALGVIGVFGFIMIWDQYLLPLIVAREPAQFTLPIALRTLRADDEVGLGVLLAAALLALLPSVVAFLLFQRQFASGFSQRSIDR
jgi:multiple sugar transport system permease protein